MSRNIYSKLWRLAGYSPYLMDYCPTLCNKAAGIGVYFLFQYFILFVSLVTGFIVYFPNYLALGAFVGSLAIFIFYKWIDLLNRIHHNNHNIGILTIHLFFNFIFSLILSTPFWLFLFEHQVIYNLYLKTGEISFGQSEQLWLKPMGLYESWFSESEGVIIFAICIAIFMVIAFVYTIPYFLIFNDRKSNYTQVKFNYEKHFK
jgi:hypothetical protein